MGFYVEVPHHKGKAAQLCELHGGQIVKPITNLSEVPKGKVLVVVVQNAAFDAAAIAYNQPELNEFNRPQDYRDKTFVLLDRAKVLELSPFVPLEY